MAELKAKLDDIDLLIGSIRTNKDKIDISVSSIKQPSKSKGIMVTTYIDRIKDISSLLDKYKQLLEKDIFDIDASKKKIEEMDREMKDLYKNV